MPQKPAFDPSKPFEAVGSQKPPFDPSKPFEVAAEPSGPGIPEMIETAGRSALEGITLGLSEPAISGANAVLGNLINAGFDATDINDFIARATSGPGIEQEYTKEVARRKELEAKLPEIAIPAEIAGGVLSGLATGGAAQVGGLAKGLTAPIRGLEALAGAAAKKIPTTVGQAAVRGALSAGGAEAIKAAAQVPTGVSPAEEFDIAQAAGFGAKLGGGLQAVASGARALKAGVPKVLSALGGVSEEAIQDYIKDPGAITRAKSPEQIKDSIDQFVSKLAQDVEDAKLSADDAKEAFKTVQDDLKQAAAKRADEFRMEKFDATATAREAKQKLDDAIRIAKIDTESRLTAQKLNLRDESVSAVEALKEKVKAGSAQSYEALLKSGRVVQVKPALNAAKEQLENLKVQGKVPVTGAAAAAYKKIQGYVDDLKRYKNILSTRDAKRKIQQLDQDFQAAITSGEFTEIEQQALRAIRRSIDAQLKDYAPYAKIMQQVSADTDLLTRANKAFGNLERAQGRTARVDLPERDLDRSLLIQLGQATQKDFESAIKKIQQGQTQLAGGLEAAVMAKPVGIEAQRAAQELEAFKFPLAQQKAVEPILQGPLAQAVTQAEEELARRQQVLADAQARIQSIGPLARSATNISAVRAAVSEKNPEFKKYLQSLTELSGEDFMKAIDDLRLAEQFGKEFRIGSRNVNLWALGTGATMYAFTGEPISALAVAGLGGGFGSLVDRFGPRMTQRVLDGYLKIDGIPTLQKIDRAFSGLPKPLINQIKDDLIRSFSVSTPEEVPVSDVERPMYLQEIKTSRALSPLEKARATLKMERFGIIDSGIVSKIAIGEPTTITPRGFNSFNAIKAERRMER